MYNTFVFSEGKEIISSGSIISFNGEPITIKVNEDSVPMFTLKFVFQERSDVKDPKLSTTVSNDTMIFTLTNFNNPIGSGTHTPIDFATYKNRNLYLHFRVNALSNSDKTFYYTIYAEEGDGHEN